MKTLYVKLPEQLPNVRMIITLSTLLILCTLFPLDALANYSFIFLIGTYSVGTASKGIYSIKLDTQAGLFSPPELVAESDNPSFLLYQASSNTLYAVNELETGAVSTFKHQGNSFTLTQQFAIKGRHPCHLNLVNEDKHLGVASYSSGNVSLLRREQSGMLDESSLATVTHCGTGVNSERQEAPHAHWVGAIGNEYIYSVDLGADKIFKSRLDEEGRLSHLETAIELNPGDGPRHIEKHPAKNIVYLVNELSNTIAVLSVQDNGNFCEQQRINLLPAATHTQNLGAAVKLDKTANYLYVSNRGHNSIASYQVLANGNLSWLANVSSEGLWPRDILVTDDNQFLLVANEHSNAVNLLRIDPQTGALQATEEAAAIACPTSIVCFA